MSEFTLRLAAPADAPAIVARAHSAYRGDSGRRGWTSEADLIDGPRTDVAEVTQMIANPRGLVLLAIASDGDVAGCCALECGDGGVAHFGLLAVDPERQASGLGRRLVAEVERRAAERFGATRMALHVVAGRDPLIGWYERQGYRLTGERAAFPHGDPRYGAPRSADLHFLVMDKPLPPAPAQKIE